MVENVILCDVAWVARADVHVIDALARLQLAAKRRGRRLVLQNASHDLADLVGLMGLAEALGLEARRQPEQREERLGVEVERELGEPPA